MGIEPTSSAWKAEVLPLNYTRSVRHLFPAILAGRSVNYTRFVGFRLLGFSPLIRKLAP